MTHDEAKRITGLMMERWPSKAKWTSRFLADWLEWLKPLNIDSNQADACLRQCSAEGQSPLMDAHRPKILDRLRRCQFVGREQAPADEPPEPPYTLADAEAALAEARRRNEPRHLLDARERLVEWLRTGVKPELEVPG